MKKMTINNGNVSYKDVKKDEKGWVDAAVFSPYPYDLMWLKIKGRRIPLAGWWTGHVFDGSNVMPSYQVTHWKRNLPAS